MYVEWLAPERVTRPFPLVLVHGGGGQGTDWLVTPDGRPGWAYRFASEGYAVYVVDRPGHGRSPYHPDTLGAPGGATTSEAAAFLFASPQDDSHTQWPWDGEAGSAELEQLAASMAFLLEDAEQSQRLDGERLGALLERTGPAVLITHSAGAPAGWLALNAHPELVNGIVAIEPMGPPYFDVPGFPALPWGITATPLAVDPPVREVSELAQGLEGHRVVGFDTAPVLIVAGAVSAFGQGAGPAVAAFVNEAGGDATFLSLADEDIDGNGHGLMFEANSERTIEPVLTWLERIGR